MRFSTIHTLPQATPTQVWGWLFETNYLVAAVPSCQQVIWLKPNEQVRLVIQRRLGPLESLHLWCDITLTDQQAPHNYAYEVVVRTSGEVETAVGHGHVKLIASGGDVQLHHELEWEATGVLASVGEMLLETQTRAVLRQALAVLETAVQTGQQPIPLVPRLAPPTRPWEPILLGVGAAVAALLLLLIGRRWRKTRR
jgi:carbon monoxide dehydrogenase subunit G